MARWSEMSINKTFSRRNEIVREVEVYDDYKYDVDDLFKENVKNYGLTEDFINGYGVEEVYSTLSMWN